MAYVKDLRTLVYNVINSKKIASQYVINTFTLKATHIPFAALKNMPPTGEVYVIGLSAFDVPNLTRSNVCFKQVPIQVGIRCKADPQTQGSLIDNLIELDEQLRDDLRLRVNKDDNIWQWLRNEPILDENKTPFAYTSLMDVGLFETFFTAYFQAVIT